MPQQPPLSDEKCLAICELTDGACRCARSLTVALSGTGTSANTNLALNQPVTASGNTQNYFPSNAVDGNIST